MWYSELQVASKTRIRTTAINHYSLLPSCPDYSSYKTIKKSMRWKIVVFLPLYRSTTMNWQTLPQRIRQRRRYLASSDAPPTSTQRRKNRPGFNSYLKVDLDTSILRRLRDITLDVSARLNTTLSERQSMDKANLRKRTLRIKPRSLSSLHMTLFFGGETLCEIPVDELKTWHGQVSKRLMESFNDKLDFSFQIAGLQLFPPQRSNLIVAILEPTENWHILHNDIRAFASEHETLKRVLEAGRAHWTAHITLANLVNERNNPEMKVLSEILDSTQVNMPVLPSAISMGGPVPKQATLDWTFPFSTESQTKEL